MPSRRDKRHLSLRLHGWLRLGVWLIALYEAHDPWNALGGLASERQRWAERFAISVMFQVGCLAGAFAEDVRDRGKQPRLWATHSVPLAIALLTLIGLEARGETYRGLVVFSGVLAYCAGFDVRFAAWPRMHGRPLPGRSSVSRPRPQLARGLRYRATVDRRVR